MKYKIFNLVFPDYIERLTIQGYQFERVEKYKDAYYGLMHKVHISGIEFPIAKLNTGSNQITSTVVEQNKEALLPWAEGSQTLLNDICFLFSIFTGRNVFYYPEAESLEDLVLLVDSREHRYGGILHTSLPNVEGFLVDKTNEVIEKQPLDGEFMIDYIIVDLSFEKGINQVIKTISSQSWKQKYENGYYLFLYRQALAVSTIESSFLLFWIVWENLYATHNSHKTEDELRNTSGNEKIKFLIEEYFYKNLSQNSINEIERIVRARNRLTHYGKSPTNVDIAEMELFVRATECLVSKTLGLIPSELFNTNARLKKLLKI